MKYVLTILAIWGNDIQEAKAKIDEILAAVVEQGLGGIARLFQRRGEIAPRAIVELEGPALPRCFKLCSVPAGR